MATFNKFHAFAEAVAEKKHDLGSDQLVVALCAAANAPVASSDAVLADLTEASYTNLSSRNITTTSSAQTSGTYKLELADLTLAASGGSVGPFRYVVVYNDDAASDDLIGFYDYGSDLTLNNGEDILIDFNQATGAITLA